MSDFYDFSNTLERVKARKQQEREEFQRITTSASNRIKGIKDIEVWFKKVRLRGFDSEIVPQKVEGQPCLGVMLSLWRKEPNYEGGPPADVRTDRYELFARAKEDRKQIEFCFAKNGSPHKEPEAILRTLERVDIDEIQVKQVLDEFVDRIAEDIY